VDNDFTLEKLKIDERLRAVELQIGHLVAHAESERGTVKRINQEFSAKFKSMEDSINKLNYAIVGNGSPGLSERVRTLEHKDFSDDFKKNAKQLDEISSKQNFILKVLSGVGAFVFAIVAKLGYDVVHWIIRLGK